MSVAMDNPGIPPVVPEINNKREQVSWYFYDWANSAFSTTVVTTFLGPYLTEVARAAAGPDGYIHPFGIRMDPRSYFAYAVSLSVVFEVLVLPLLGAIADYSQVKKQMLGIFAYIGAFATMGLFFLHGTNYMLGGGLFILANVSFGASIVFSNAFLPDIASPDRIDHVSSMGWALGYIGGGVLLALNLALFSQAAQLGLTTEQAVRISLASAGMWWALFALLPLTRLRNRKPTKSMPPGQTVLTIGFTQLKHTISKVTHYPQTVVFLVAYLIYNDGIQTVITLASQFGQEELKLSISTLTTVILMVQFIGFFGNVLFDKLAKRVGAKNAVMISLVIWTGTLIYVYGFLKTELHFYILGGVIGLIIGGSQALSRSLFSLMIPKGQESEYFGVYEISDKGTSWLGPLIFGLALDLTGNYRLALLSLVVFFAVGLILLSIVNVKKAMIEAGNA